MAQQASLTTILQTKLSFLESTKTELHGHLDAFINKAISSAEKALQTKEASLTELREINSRLDIALEFLLAECDKFNRMRAGEDVTTAQWLTTQPSTASFNTGPSGCDAAEVTRLCHRIETIEIAMSATDSKIDQQSESREMIVSQIQGLEEKMASLETKSKDFEERQKQKFSDVEEQMKKVRAKNKQQKTQISSLEGQLKNVDDKHLKKLKEQESQYKYNLEKAVKDIEKKQVDEMKEIDCRLDDVEKKLKNMESREKDITKQRDDRLECLELMTDGLSSYMGTMATKDNLRECMELINKNRHDIEELTSRLTSAETSIATESETRRRKSTEHENGLKTLRRKTKKDFDDLDKKVQDLDSYYKQLCKMMANHLNPLMRLRKNLNELHMKVEKRDNLAKRMDDIAGNVDDLSEKVQGLETKCSQKPVGFTAYSTSRATIKEGAIVRSFTDVYCNEGGHYNPSTGKFTVPKDGLYVVNVSIRQLKEGEFQTVVKRERGNDGKVLCKTKTSVNETSSCGISVARMKQGDVIWGEFRYVEKNPLLSDSSSFSCLCIG